MSTRFVKILKNPFVVSFLLAILIGWGLIYGTLLWLDSYTRHNQAVVVPDVKGMTVDEAEPSLAERGLRYNIIDSVFSKDVPPGAIVEVVPAPGSKVKQGRILFVTINANTSLMAVLPEVADLSFRQAYALLRSLGFSSVEVKYITGDYRKLALGVVWYQRTGDPGRHIPVYSRLVLIVSSGEAEIDSTALDSLNMLPIEPLDSEVENWF